MITSNNRTEGGATAHTYFKRLDHCLIDSLAQGTSLFTSAVKEPIA